MQKLIIAILMLGLVSGLFVAVAATPVPDDYISELEWTDTVTVRGGDSLWSIVNKVNNGNYDSRVLIDAVKEVNDIGSIIRPGQTLIVPVVE